MLAIDSVLAALNSDQRRVVRWRIYGDDGTPLTRDRVAERFHESTKTADKFFKDTLAEIYHKLRGG